MKFLRYACAALVTAMGFTSGALADTFSYVNWQTANVSAGTASGVINVPGSASPVTVDFKATFADGSPGTLYFAQTNGGTNYWAANGGAPYISASVSNPPPDSDILALVGGTNQIYTVTLSEPIKDPIMAILSLGQGGVPTTYDFDAPFTIVSQGPGHWGGTATSLSQLPGDILRGTEGHGTIRFNGTFSTFSWTVPTPETWHGFTFGIRTTEALEPTPDPVPLPSAAGAGIVMLSSLVLRRRKTQA